MMLDWLRYRHELTRLQREKRRIQAYHEKAWRKATEEKQPQQELSILLAGEGHELTMVRDEIAQLETRYLISEAEKYLLQEPPLDEKEGKWEKAIHSERYQLTPAGFKE